MKRLLPLIILVFGIAAFGQVAPQIQGAGAPSNPCTNGGQDYVDQTNHVLYHCPSSGSNWVNVGLGNKTGGGVPGGNSLSIQYNNSGALNGDNSITTDGSGNLTAASISLTSQKVWDFTTAVMLAGNASTTRFGSCTGSLACVSENAGSPTELQKRNQGSAFFCVNNGATGTTVNLLVKDDGAAASKCVNAATTDTAAILGVALPAFSDGAYGPGTTGNVLVGTSGKFSCLFDATAVTEGDYVQISSTVAGNCHDAGASRPTSGQIIGKAASSGSASTVQTVYFGTGNDIQGVASSSTVGTIFTGSNLNAGIATGGSVFANVSWSGSTAFSATENSRYSAIPVACTAKNLYVITNSAQPASNTLAIFVRKCPGGSSCADTAVTVTVAAGAAAGTFSDTTHTVSFAAGDFIDIHGTETGASTSATIGGVSFQCN